MPDFQFVKSNYSSGNGECVEVARNVLMVTAVRDSKNPHGCSLVFTADAWTAFVAAVKTGELSLAG
jgi:hypothetical protein